MHIVAYYCLLLAFLFSLVLAAWTLSSLSSYLDKKLCSFKWIERFQLINLFLLVLASFVLLWALYVRDFSFAYVVDYTDTTLPWFYALTAFWAGQEGSFLFWALFLSLFGSLFVFMSSYKSLSDLTKKYFWILFFIIQAFFLLVLTGPSNPFQQLSPSPIEGNGLNPLLQHPGMIFHPPLLFIGYAGFSIPACIGLSASLGREDKSWLRISRNWVLFSWILLTAGIILGAWWSYMELGWGGYWAWDPVENASLIPWLCATAFIHTSIIGRQRKSLGRTNIFLIGMTLLLCFFGTFLTRSGVLESLHAFGGQNVGGFLLVFMLFLLALILLVTFKGEAREKNQLSDFITTPGAMLVLTWLLLFTGIVIVLGTMWPVISRLWSENPIGVNADFYNQVCLPLFTISIFLLVLCPWLGKRLRSSSLFQIVLVAFFLILAAILWSQGMNSFLPLLAATLSITACLSIIILFFAEKGIRKVRTRWGAYGVHFGVALIALGVAFSGPYKQERETVLDKGQSFSIKEYTFTYKDFSEYTSPGMAAYQAQIEVSNADKIIGKLTPERRIYQNFKQPFAEVSVLPSLGNEIYATLLGFSRDQVIRLQVSVNPLVNWIWIGGTLMCLMGFVALKKRTVYFDGKVDEVAD